jgi:hypothetical protein
VALPVARRQAPAARIHRQPVAVSEQLFMLKRLLLGLCEEVAEQRRNLIDNLGKVLGFYNGRWRQLDRKRQGVMLRHYLRIGLEVIFVP